MAVVDYIDLPHCTPTSIEEVTQVDAETSENGVIRGRVWFNESVYKLTLTHAELEIDEYERFRQFWHDHRRDETRVTWKADGATYQGIFSGAPTYTYAPFRRMTVSVTLLVKQVP